MQLARWMFPYLLLIALVALLRRVPQRAAPLPRAGAVAGPAESGDHRRGGGADAEAGHRLALVVGRAPRGRAAVGVAARGAASRVASRSCRCGNRRIRPWARSGDCWRRATLGAAMYQINVLLSTTSRRCCRRAACRPCGTPAGCLRVSDRPRRGRARHRGAAELRRAGRAPGARRDAAQPQLRHLAHQLRRDSRVGRAGRFWRGRSPRCCSSAGPSPPPTSSLTARGAAGLRRGLWALALVARHRAGVLRAARPAYAGAGRGGGIRRQPARQPRPGRLAAVCRRVGVRRGDRGAPPTRCASPISAMSAWRWRRRSRLTVNVALLVVPITRRLGGLDVAAIGAVAGAGVGGGRRDGGAAGMRRRRRCVDWTARGHGPRRVAGGDRRGRRLRRSRWWRCCSAGARSTPAPPVAERTRRRNAVSGRRTPLVSARERERGSLINRRLRSGASSHVRQRPLRRLPERLELVGRWRRGRRAARRRAPPPCGGSAPRSGRRRRSARPRRLTPRCRASEVPA